MATKRVPSCPLSDSATFLQGSPVPAQFKTLLPLHPGVGISRGHDQLEIGGDGPSFLIRVCGEGMGPPGVASRGRQVGVVGLIRVLHGP